MNTANIRYREMAEIIIRKMHEEDWCAVREIYQEGIATGNATFQTAAPEWLEWNEGHLQDCRYVATVDNRVVGWAALSPFFPPACIPRCRRAEHLCQYSFSGKRRGQGFALRADKGLGKCGFLDATCWHLSGKPGQCCFTSQPGIQGSRLPGKSG